MSDNSELTKYFGDVNSQNTGFPFENIGFRQLAKNEELQEAGSNSKEDPPVLVSTLFQSSGVKNSDAANFFDMIGSSGIGDLKRDFLVSDTTPENILSRPMTKPGIVSDADRSRAAWIPLESTRRILIAMVTSPPGTYTHDKENLTMPGVVLKEDLMDPVTEAVNHYLGAEEASKRKILMASNVTQDVRGIKLLIKGGFYCAAINLTTHLLNIYGQGVDRAGHPSKHTLHSIQLWFTRLSLLVKLRSFSIADVEAQPFGDLDRPDLFFQFYPELYGGRLGSLVPFGFRLLLAQIPMFMGKHQICLPKLHKILATVRKMVANLENGLLEDGTPCDLDPASKEEALSIWRQRETLVLHNIINCALSYKDYTLAIEVMNVLLSRNHDEQEEVILKSALGRIMLQIGDLVSAEKLFQPLRNLSDPNKAIRSLIDTGLFQVSNGRFTEALHTFEKAVKIEPNNVMVLNNMSVCLLYLGRLKDAVVLLENGLQACPSLALHESYLLNLCNFYELQSVNSLNSKLHLLSLISQHRGDNVNMACLKLNTGV